MCWALKSIIHGLSVPRLRCKEWGHLSSQDTYTKAQRCPGLNTWGQVCQLSVPDKVCPGWMTVEKPKSETLTLFWSSRSMFSGCKMCMCMCKATCRKSGRQVHGEKWSHVAHAWGLGGALATGWFFKTTMFLLSVYIELLIITKSNHCQWMGSLAVFTLVMIINNVRSNGTIDIIELVIKI